MAVSPFPARSATSALISGRRPAFGIVAVLLGAIISTLDGRVTSFGLADVRGGLHFGFDEASWLPSVNGAAQMLIAPLAAWLAGLLGARRVLLAGGAVFLVGSILLPTASSFPVALGLQAIRGLGSGTFVPLTISFLVGNLSPRLKIFGIAAYAMSSTLSQNVAASIEGVYGEHGAWEWIFWQHVILVPLMMGGVLLGMPRTRFTPRTASAADWPAMIFLPVSLAVIYLALDQGNRLGWLGSKTIVFLLLLGAVTFAAYLVDEVRAPKPWHPIRVFFNTQLGTLLVLLGLFRFAALGTAFVLPQYLVSIQGYRAMQLGPILLWVALPQLLLAPIVALALRRVDGRVGLAIGFALLAVADALPAALTHDWARDDFLPAQILEAVALCVAMTSIVSVIVTHIRPATAAQIGASLQIARLFGGEIGIAALGTFVRVREQRDSALLGLHVTGDSRTVERLQALGGEASSPAALRALAGVVRREAFVLSYRDAFELAAAAAAFAAIIVVVAHRRIAPPPPAKRP